MAEAFLGSLVLAFFFVWLPCGGFSAVIAGDKGHHGFVWFLMGVVFGPMALIAAAGLGDSRLRKSIRNLVEQGGQINQ